MNLKIPYGLSNFKDVITEGYVYVDKTMWIARLEEHGKYQFLLRPRRFGKSLFLSMLEYYYDCKRADEFDALFGKLYVSQHPTPLKNAYQVVFMEFSGISTTSFERVYSGFNTSVEVGISSFIRRYGHDQALLQQIAAKESPEEKMKLFLETFQEQKILLLIDEYDHFANALMAEDLQLFQGIVGKGGFVRSFYETLKTATQRGTIDRMFMTGVTPIMLDSMTSGFNIGKNLSLLEDFNNVIGFSRSQVEVLLKALTDVCPLEHQQLMTDVAEWYNGYRFHIDADETVYNADMVLYFLDRFDYQRCAYPKKMLDPNIASDYGKLLALFTIGNRDENYAVLEELLNQGEVSARQVEKFEFDKGFGRDDFVSLLAYMGFVSLDHITLTGEAFVIPNRVIRELYFQYFKVELERRNRISLPDRALLLAVESLALNNDMQPLIAELGQVLQLLSNRDSLWLDEAHIKTILLTLLYQSPAYFIQSEREMNRKYPDILLLERSPYKVNHQHLIELKYSKKGAGDAGREAKRQEGIAQVQGYLQLPDITALDRLSAWLIVTDGNRVTAERVSAQLH